MEINDFIEKFSEQFDDTDKALLKPETEFKELDEWSSLIALSVIAMIDDEYDVQLKADEMRQTSLIQELFNLVSSKL